VIALAVASPANSSAVSLNGFQANSLPLLDAPFPSFFQLREKPPVIYWDGRGVKKKIVV
jgi:hypothetical protein